MPKNPRELYRRELCDLKNPEEAKKVAFIANLALKGGDERPKPATEADKPGQKP